MNTIKDLAKNWWATLNWSLKDSLSNFYYNGAIQSTLLDEEIENIFYQEVILKWYVGKYGKVEFDYNEKEIRNIYLKEHTKEHPIYDGDGKLISGQPISEWVRCEGYSAQEYPDFKKGWGVECFNGTKGTIEAYHNPYMYIDGQVDKVHKMNVKAYMTFEQPQSVDNAIDVEEVNYQSSNLVTEKKEAIEFADYLLGNFEMAEFEKEHPKYVVDDELCWQLAGTKQKYTTVEMYQIYLNDTNKSQPKAIEDNVWDEAQKEYHKLYSVKSMSGLNILTIPQRHLFKWLKQHYSLIKK